MTTASNSICVKEAIVPLLTPMPKYITVYPRLKCKKKSKTVKAPEENMGKSCRALE